MNQEIEIRGEKFELLSDGALFWPATGILAVADFHLGKAESFGRQGYPLPEAAQFADLDRLRNTARTTGAREILFLGDLVHTRDGITPVLARRFGDWVEEFVGRVTLIAGNHDRALIARWPADWRKIEVRPELRVGPFLFRHEPPATPTEGAKADAFIWAGHVHPCIRLEAGADRLRLKTFVVEGHYGILPAFSSLAGGFNIEPGMDTRLFPISDGEVHSL